MKKLIATLSILILSVAVFAQAKLATADYQKTMQPAVEVEIPFPEKTVLKAIDDTLQKMGYKGKETKGYVVYKGVKMPQLGTESYDLYFKTDRKSKQQKDVTILTMMISSGFDKFIGETTDAPVINNAKSFLNKQTDMVVAYDLEQQIKDQEESTKKADKKLSGLVEDAESLQKKKTKLDNDIAENLKQQETQKAEAEKQKQILVTLKGKRKA